MRCTLFAFILLSVQALKIQQGKGKTEVRKEVFDDKTSKLKTTEDDEIRFVTEHLVVPELKPSDFKQKVGLNGSVMSNVLYAGANAAVLGLIGLIYYDRGLVTVLSIMSLILSLSFMSNTIKEIYVQGFKYPEFITSCHQLSSCIAAFTILMCRSAITGQKVTYPSMTTVLQGLGPVALCFGASLGCSNMALLYTNTHFYEMLTPMSPLVTFTIGLILGQNKSMKLLPPVLLVASALPLVAFGEVKVSAIGILCVTCGVLFRSCKAQLNSLLMSAGAMPQSFDPVELTCWTTMLTFVVMLIWSSVKVGTAPFEAINDAGIIVALLVSSINAVVLNLSVLFVMKEIGPVAQQILGELKGVLATLGAVAAFGEVVTLQQCIAYSLAVIGVHWYNKTDMQVREEEREAAEQLVKDNEK